VAVDSILQQLDTFFPLLRLNKRLGVLLNLAQRRCIIGVPGSALR
jgi:hypothetical protein